jgi:ACS family tartrate transporter-like MFS transporter
MDDALRRTVLTKVSLRLIPFLFLLYVVNILDRVNVGVARLQMDGDLKMEEWEYSLGAGIFYIGYVLFEIPSNLILRRLGARRWIARILISWGLVTCATAAVTGPWSFCAMRVLLGFAEAGFFPGIILYLTYWYTARERARAVAFFMAASPVTSILGNPLSGAILEFMDRAGGLRGWQWVFVLEGLPAIVLGFVALRFLTDRPEEADWLAPEERDWLSGHVAGEEKARLGRHHLSLRRAMTDGRVWLLCALYFTIATGANSYGLYAPKLVKDLYPGRGEFAIGVLTAIPSICAAVCMVLSGMHSDATGERRWHVAVPAILAAAGACQYVVFDAPVVRLAGLALWQAGIMSMLPAFWALPTAFLSGVAAAGGIALINSVGNLGGFVGPNAIGLLKDQTTGSFTFGLLAIALTMMMGGGLALGVPKDRAETAKMP